MALHDLRERLRKAQESVRKLAAMVAERDQQEQEVANGLDDISKLADDAIASSGTGGGSTGGGSGAHQPQQGMSAQQAAAAVSGQRPGGQPGR